MDVLHVSDTYLPRVGGIELHLRDLVAHQQARGLDVALVTTTRAAPPDPTRAGPARSVDPSWVWRASTGRHPLPTQATGTYVRRLLRHHRPAVVHVHVSVFSPFAALAAQEAVGLGVPVVVTVHSMWEGLGPVPLVARAGLGVRAWPVVWSAVSRPAAEALTPLLGERVAVHVLPNAIDLAAWRPDRTAAASTGRPSPVVASVMRLTTVKRAVPLVRMLRAVHESVPDVRAVVIGDGPKRGAVERYLARHRMSGWVELTGRLERSAIRSRLEQSSLFLAPAERESFGIAALEARALGLPVVGSSRSGLVEFVRHDVEGLLAEDDPAMCGALVSLLTDHARRGRITEHNRSVAPVHDWSRACRDANALYAQAADLVHLRGPGRSRVLETTGPARSSS